MITHGICISPFALKIGMIFIAQFVTYAAMRIVSDNWWWRCAAVTTSFTVGQVLFRWL